MDDRYVLQLKPYLRSYEYINLISTSWWNRERGLQGIRDVKWSRHFGISNIWIKDHVKMMIKKDHQSDQVKHRQQFVDQLVNLEWSELTAYNTDEFLWTAKQGCLDCVDELTLLHEEYRYGMVAPSLGRFTRLLENRFSDLQWLRIMDFSMENNYLKHLAKAVKNGWLDNLELLDIHGVDINGFKYLAKQLHRLPNLKYLLLWGELTNHGLTDLSNALANNALPQLERLTIERGGLRNDVDTLKQAFRSGHMANLKHLWVKDSDVRTDQFIQFIDAMIEGKMTKLVELDFMGNKIRGCEAYLRDTLDADHFPMLKEMYV